MGLSSRKSSVSDEVERLMDDLRDLISNRELDDLPQIRQLRDKLDDGIEGVRRATVDAAHEAASRAKESAQAANQYAHDEPWQVAGVAIAVGALVGYLIARR